MPARDHDDDGCDELCCGEDICLNRGMDPEGTCMQCVTVLLISTAAVIMNFFVIGPWLGFSAVGISQYVFGNGIMVMMFTSYFRAACTTSFVPDDWDSSQSDYPDCFLDAGKPKFCKVCKRDKPPRAHHCSTCGKCVMRMDHHCPWINNCVGQSNHRYFLQFLFWTSMGCAYVIFMSFLFMLNSCILTQLGGKLRGGLGGAAKNATLAAAATEAGSKFFDMSKCTNFVHVTTPIFMGVAMLIAVVFGAMVTMLGCYQFYMALLNTTEIESWQFEKIKRQANKEGKYWDNPYHRGRYLDNLVDICGRGSLWLYLIPCHKSKLDPGTTYKFNSVYSKLKNPVRTHSSSEDEAASFVNNRSRPETRAAGGGTGAPSSRSGSQERRAADVEMDQL